MLKVYYCMSKRPSLQYESLVSQLPENLEAARVFNASRFISHYCSKHSDDLDALLSNMHRAYDKSDYHKQLSSLPLTYDEGSFKKKLREFRIRETVRIAWRSILAFAKIEETLLELSYLADCLILHALSYAFHHLNLDNEKELNAQKIPALYVVALGKLGGYELNFSSDIDIYFAYPYEAILNKKTSAMASQYYTQLAQKTLHLLADKTADGFVYRVDLRLRPYGQSGPLTMSFSQLETYYQEQGRDWERYSLVKARVINDSDLHTKTLTNLLTPFTYRRYTDFSILESLRSLKLLMAREEKLKKMTDDIKRGPGGIREVEFLVQSLQLIHGGRDRRLQTPSLFIAINKLTKKKLLKPDVAERIKESYRFFRLLENAIQFFEDKQRHKLPSQEDAQQALCYALDFDDYDKLCAKLSEHRQFIQIQFSQVLSQPIQDDQADQKLLEKQLRALWLGQLGDIPSIDVLSSLGFNHPEHAYSQLQSFASSPKCRRLSQVARLRLDNFMPLLLLELSRAENVDNLLTLILRLLDGIIKRSTYLALLIENPSTLRHVIKLFNRSVLIANLVSEQPFLLEVLLDEASLLTPLVKRELQQALHELIQEHSEVEKKIECLKEFKHQQTLKIAVREVLGEIDVVMASYELTLVTEVILKNVLDIAINELSLKFNVKTLAQHFLIVAYGKLGSAEMSYSSDLDLVFLHDCNEELSSYAVRLAQKVLHLLQTRTVHGKLYQVDTRLRPSGSAGMLVSHIAAFCDYQKTRAWTWEHQALVKARAVAGSDDIKVSFIQLRTDIFFLKRSKDKLYEDITAMLIKLRKEHSSSTKSDEFKFAVGGLIEIEFLVQFAVLIFSKKHPELLEKGNTSYLMTTLSSLSLIDKKDAEILLKSYQTLMQSAHWYALKGCHNHGEYHSELVHQLVKKVYRHWLS